MKSLNVLVVEDDDDIRMLVADAFRALGCKVREAEHGQHALDLLLQDRWKPDVIVLDIIMPVMDGLTFLARKREARDLSQIPVVVVSGSVNGPIPGVSAIVRKPVDIDEMVRIVRRHAA